MKMTQPDRDDELLEKHRRDVDDAREFMEVCSMADTNQSGTFSLADFEFSMTNDKVREYFDLRGIDIKDARLFYEMIASSTNSEEVDLEAFVGSCLRVRGNATSIDLHTLAFEFKMMSRFQEHFFTFVEERLNGLGDTLSKLGLCMSGEANASLWTGTPNSHFRRNSLRTPSSLGVSLPMSGSAPLF
eukprot:TRINITY_DN7964_c0_g1_i1.p1 TRINITY_DN7964_c0_g1~~TRINITY_DN7964_c0_g1_i1.p1  ORF type:complete len:187 (-),score=29.41 TRINITY_DN7964_c0_g1_i1:217-777(-)